MLPSEFTQLEYVESTGTQYIDTRVVADWGTRVVGDFMPFSAENAGESDGFVPYGCGIASANNEFGLYSWDGQFEVNYASVYQFVSNIVTGVVVHIDQNQNECSISNNGDFIATFDKSLFTTGRTLYLMGYNRPGYFFGGRQRCYGAEVYDNGNLVRKYVPAMRVSDSVAGFYDIVGSQFSPSLSGSFIAGPEFKLEITGKELVTLAQTARALGIEAVPSDIDSAPVTIAQLKRVTDKIRAEQDSVDEITQRLATVNGVSGDSSAQLSALDSTKLALEKAIEAKGVDVPAGTAFSDYAGKIGEIAQSETCDVTFSYFGTSGVNKFVWLSYTDPEKGWVGPTNLSYGGAVQVNSGDRVSIVKGTTIIATVQRNSAGYIPNITCGGGVSLFPDASWNPYFNGTTVSCILKVDGDGMLGW